MKVNSWQQNEIPIDIIHSTQIKTRTDLTTEIETRSGINPNAMTAKPKK